MEADFVGDPELANLVFWWTLYSRQICLVYYYMWSIIIASLLSVDYIIRKPSVAVITSALNSTYGSGNLLVITFFLFCSGTSSIFHGVDDITSKTENKVTERQ